MVKKYISKLRELNVADALLSNGTPAAAAPTQLMLSKYGVKAIPKKEQSALHRKYFVDCWSPTMVALDAHLHMVIEIAEHLNGLGRKVWWSTKAVQGEQIRQRADVWETTVRDLKWGRALTSGVQELCRGRSGQADAVRAGRPVLPSEVYEAT